MEHRIEIRPPTPWGASRLSDLWEYRELAYFLTKRELQVRYKQSILGVAWVVLQPLALMAVFSFLFSGLINVESEGIPYPIYALAGIATWLFVSQSIGQASGSLVADANMLSKVHFPRLIIPLAKILALLVDLTIVTALLVVVVVVVVGVPGVEALTFPLWILLAGTFALGMALFTATLNVRYRDVAIVVPFLLQIGMFVTPVAYPASLVSGAWEYVYALNPAASAITGVRWALMGTATPQLVPLLVSIAVTIVALIGGSLYFKRSEQHFADVI